MFSIYKDEKQWKKFKTSAGKEKFVSHNMLQFESGLISRVEFIRFLINYCLERLSFVYFFVRTHRFTFLIFNMKHDNETIINLIYVEFFLKTR